MDKLTQTLLAIEAGQQQAAADLFPLVYDELRKLAAAQLARESPGQTLQATALVNEAFLRLVQSDLRRDWSSARHFFAVAAEVMRHLLVDNARRKKRLKHGGAARRVHVDLAALGQQLDDSQLLSLNVALEELEAQSPEKARLIVLRYFGGLSIEQACDLMGISRTTAHRYWTFARAWLHRRIGELENGES